MHAFQTVRTQLGRAIAAALLTFGAIAAANASNGFVTTNEVALDLIYSQPSFGLTPIDIRFDPAITLSVPSTLLTIDNDAEFDSLHTYETGSPVVSMFYLDHINFCGGPSDGIVGCGSTPGTLIAIDSAAATESFGGVVVAHELGHNLSLEHAAGTNTNLMNPDAYEGPAPAPLTVAQVAQIFTSPLVQHDAKGFYIEVQPFALIATAVPEPSTYALMGLGAGVLAFVRKRKVAAS